MPSEFQKKGMVVLASVVAALVVAACARTDHRAAAPPGARVCAAVSETQGLVTSLARDGRSGTVAIARLGRGPLAGKTLAFVADADAAAVFTVDVDGRRVVATLALDTSPAELLVLPDGRIAASLPMADALTILHPREDGSLVRGCDVHVATEPRSIALAGERLLVSSAFGHTIEALAVSDLSPQAKVDVPREPRQIAVSADGRRAFVTHAIGGIVSVLDLGTMRVERTIPLAQAPASSDDPTPSLERAVSRLAARATVIPGKNGARAGVQGFAVVETRAPRGRVLVPHTLVDPGDPESRPVGIGIASAATIASVALIDGGTLEVADGAGVVPPFFGLDMEDRGFRPSLPADVPDCLLPRAATIDDATTTLLVACFGIDALLAFDAASAAPMAVERARWNVPAGPTGVVVDGERRRAVVFSQFERVLEILKLDDLESSSSPSATHDRIELPPLAKPLSLAMSLGRQTFYATGDSRISVTGAGCASCHVDGRDDGLVWATEDGPRRTRAVAGIGEESAPFGWDGKSATVEEHLQREFKRLRGRGLRNVQLDGLLGFVRTMWMPARRGSTFDAALVARGKALFDSPARGCATCHPAGGTDKKPHRIGSATSWDRKVAFVPPALSRVADRAPYFHDGRFKTLGELLSTHLDVERGQSEERPERPRTVDQDEPAPAPGSKWTESDREAIAAYLESL